jgi:two-component system, chemotaxis family, protein-glutamate methylesterase/glutaminase
MIRQALVPKVMQFLSPTLKFKNIEPTEKIKNTETPPPKKRIDKLLLEAVVIASSTGGPTALEAIFTNLKGPFRKPIFIAQHMPPVFTGILAKRMSELCGVIVKEGEDGEKVEAGKVYIAPGDWHMVLKKIDRDVYISLNQDPQRNSVRPAADFLFESAAAIYKNSLLGVVLTGMGEDGAQGAAAVRAADGAVIIQDKESCVVFGMPGAVFQNDDYDEIGDLRKISQTIKSVVS